MMKQGVVAESVSEINGLAVLPPLNNLPQWSRVNTLDRARYPKKFVKDVPNERIFENGNTEEDDMAASSDDRIQDPCANPARVEHLQKSITFLRQQHQEILSHLHEEIDVLKRSNKEMHFKIVMVQSPYSSAKQRRRLPDSRHDTNDTKQQGVSSELVAEVNAESTVRAEHHYDQQQQVSDEKLDELKMMFLEEEVKELKRFLREEKSKNQYLTNLAEVAEKQRDKKHYKKPISSSSAAVGRRHVVREGVGRARVMSAGSGVGPSSESGESMEAVGGMPGALLSGVGVLPFNATVSPLQVNLPRQAPRTPTLHECQVIIRHLHGIGDKQAHELNQLKCDLRDVLYSHKWSPDAYLLAKAYIADDDQREEALQSRLPRIPLRQPTKKLPDLAYLPRDAVSLPALKQTLGNKAVERRRRTQILQKARLHREVLH